MLNAFWISIPFCPVDLGCQRHQRSYSHSSYSRRTVGLCYHPMRMKGGVEGPFCIMWIRFQVSASDWLNK